jgi:hypothetical protein
MEMAAQIGKYSASCGVCVFSLLLAESSFDSGVVVSRKLVAVRRENGE